MSGALWSCLKLCRLSTCGPNSGAPQQVELVCMLRVLNNEAEDRGVLGEGGVERGAPVRLATPRHGAGEGEGAESHDANGSDRHHRPSKRQNLRLRGDQALRAKAEPHPVREAPHRARQEDGLAEHESTHHGVVQGVPRVELPVVQRDKAHQHPAAQGASTRAGSVATSGAGGCAVEPAPDRPRPEREGHVEGHCDEQRAERCEALGAVLQDRRDQRQAGVAATDRVLVGAVEDDGAHEAAGHQRDGRHRHPSPRCVIRLEAEHLAAKGRGGCSLPWEGWHWHGRAVALQPPEQK
mmetsp:Transcript_53076/g.106580  ORF Transcript_53076/g.106580 Transcript_53076/m.106580 type:complete len:295 (+) Transcript_53076:75-959(+)